MRRQTATASDIKPFIHSSQVLVSFLNSARMWPFSLQSGWFCRARLWRRKRTFEPVLTNAALGKNGHRHNLWAGPLMTHGQTCV